METLMGFYQIIVTIFDQCAIRFKDPIISSLMLKGHLFEIINFHKKNTEDDKIEIPKLGDIYQNYVKEWNTHIFSKENVLKKIVEDYKKNKSCSYIS